MSSPRPLSQRFTQADRRRLTRARTASKTARGFRRVDAVLQVAEGASLSTVARQVRVARLTVRRWVQRYLHTRDVTALGDRPRVGRPCDAPQLTPRHLRTLLARDPRTFGYMATTWTVALVTTHLRTHDGIVVQPWTVRRRLHAAGFRAKRPRYVYSGKATALPQKKGPWSVA